MPLKALPDIYRRHRILILDTVSVVLIIIGTFPGPLYGLQSGLDPSWTWFDGYAFAHHLQWGSQVLWTYGPLGFMALPYQYPDWGVWVASYVASAIFRNMFLTLIFMTNRNVRGIQRTPFDLVPLILGFLFLEFEGIHVDVISLVVAVIIVFRLVLLTPEQQRHPFVESGIAGPVLAASSLIKFTSFIAAVLLLAAVATTLLVDRRGRYRRCTAVLITGFSTSFIIGWAVAGQKLGNLPAYLHAAFLISSGYSAAMSIPGSRHLALIAVAMVAGYGLALGWIGKAFGWKRAGALGVIAGPLIFLFWKEGFVRMDWGHVGIFYLFMAILFLVTSLLHGTSWASKTGVILSAGIIGAYWAQTGLMTPLLKPAQERDQVALAWKLVTHPALYARWSSGAMERVQRVYHIPRLIAATVRDRKLAVLPWDILEAPANGAKLKVPPVPQLYSTYTAWLDHTDARWLTRHGPRYVLLTIKSIDDRYPLFSAPRMYKTLFSHYCLLKAAKNNLLLARRDRPAADKETPRSIRQSETRLGEKIKLADAHPGTAVTLIAHVKLSLLGRLVSMLYRPSPAFVTFYLDDGVIKGPYRFIYGVAGDGLLVSPFLDSTSAVARWLTHGRGVAVKAVKFSVAGHAWEYDQSITFRSFEHRRRGSTCS